MTISAGDVLLGCTFYPIEPVNGAPEALLRAAINRAYYSTFHAVHPHVAGLPEEKKGPISGRIGHRETYRRLIRWEHPDTDIRKNLKHSARIAALAFMKAIETRERSDYDLASTITSDDYELQLKRMREVTSFITRYEQVLAA